MLYAREFDLTFPRARDVNFINLRERASHHGGLPVFLFASEPPE